MNSKVTKALKNFRKNGDISLLIKKLNSVSKNEREKLIEELSLDTSVCNSGILIELLGKMSDLSLNEVNYITRSIIYGELSKYYIISSKVNNTYNDKIMEDLFNYGIKKQNNYILDAIISTNTTLDDVKKEKLYNYILTSNSCFLVDTALNSELYDNDKKCKLFDVYIKNKSKRYILNNYKKVDLDDKRIDSIVNIFICEPHKSELDELIQLIKFKENKKHINQIFDCLSKEIDIYHFMKLLGSQRSYLIKDYILDKKSKSLIAFYIYYTKDYKLAEEIFGSIESYILFCNVNKKNMKFETEDLYKLLDKDYFNYVDDTINCYTKSQAIV